MRIFKILRALVKPIEKRIRRTINKKIDLRIRVATKQIPIAEFVEDDVFIVGYPKSGNSWFQALVAGTIYGLDPEYIHPELIFDLIPDVHQKKYYRRYRTPIFFKSHLLPRPEYKRVIYLLRDGRDVMVSYFHWLSDLQRRRVDFLKMVQYGERLFPCKWQEHVKAWLSNPYNARMIIIKYEDLKANPVRELQRFCNFTDAKRDESFLNLVAGKTTFEKMYQKEHKYRADYPSWPQDKAFIRRGVVGSYKDEMPSNVLEAFLIQAGETLKQCGYL